jgi:uncharacterized OB-fold protein
MTTEYRKPLPRPLNPAFTKPFWEAAKRHELIMPRCTMCDHLFFYPRTECPRCLSGSIGWTPVSGRGRLHSFTIVNQPVHPAFRDDAPHVYAIVQLDEGPRMISNVVECDHPDLQIDMPLVAVFDDVTPEWTLVKFKPA